MISKKLPTLRTYESLLMPSCIFGEQNLDNIVGVVWSGNNKVILLYPDFYHICILVLNMVLTKFYTRLTWTLFWVMICEDPGIPPHHQQRHFMRIGHIKNISPLCIPLANVCEVILLDSN